MTDHSIRGKVALIAGGAKNLGGLIARDLAQQGAAAIAIHYNSDASHAEAEKTIAAIRDRSHWNIANIQPKDPVTLGLCSQRELDAIVAKAAKKAGIEAPPHHPFAGDRVALLEQLRALRTPANQVRPAQKAAVAAQADGAA